MESSNIKRGEVAIKEKKKGGTHREDSKKLRAIGPKKERRW